MFNRQISRKLLFKNIRTISAISKPVFCSETKRKKLDTLKMMYTERGNSEYMIGEPMTQMEHALQSWNLAKKKRDNDIQFAVACFLHDVGHLVPTVQNKRMAVDGKDLGQVEHEKLGKELLKEMGFPYRIYTMVGFHVLAKRYNCTVNKNYFQKLSPASKETFVQQGGLLNPDDMIYCMRNEFFRDALDLRDIDDQAKTQTLKLSSDPIFLNLAWEDVKHVL